MKNLSILTLSFVLALSACASSPENDPAYISPAHYSNYNCSQIAAEMQRVSAKMEQMGQSEQDKAAELVLGTALSAFAISQGYGLSSSESQDEVQYRRLGNQYDVLEQEAIRKEC